jgi:hypothetical protein
MLKQQISSGYPYNRFSGIVIGSTGTVAPADCVIADFYHDCKFSLGSVDAVNEVCSLCAHRPFLGEGWTILHMHCHTAFCTDCFLNRVRMDASCPKCKQQLEHLGHGRWYREMNIGMFPGIHRGKAAVAMDVPSVHRQLGGYGDEVSLVRLWDEYQEKYWDRSLAFEKMNVCYEITTDLFVDCGEDPNRFDLNVEDMYTVWKCSRILAVQSWLEITFKADSTRGFVMPWVPEIEVKESFENAIQELQLQEAMQTPSTTVQIALPTSMVREVLRWCWSSDYKIVNAVDGYKKVIEPQMRKFDELASSQGITHWYIVPISHTMVWAVPHPASRHGRMKTRSFQSFPGWNKESSLGDWADKARQDEVFLQRFLKEVEQAEQADDTEAESDRVRWWGDQAIEAKIYDRNYMRCSAVRRRRPMHPGMEGRGNWHSTARDLMDVDETDDDDEDGDGDGEDDDDDDDEVDGDETDDEDEDGDGNDEEVDHDDETDDENQGGGDDDMNSGEDDDSDAG